VSSSPWNLHGFLDAFLRRAGLPTGPLFLRDLGVDETMFIQGSHDAHKRAAIEELLALHDTSFVLVGDTGQHDPEIYRSIVASHPGRIEAVLLRHLTSDDRVEDVRHLFADVTVPLAVAGDALGMAEAAESNGLTPKGWAERVARSTAR
jgi:phosphatidate phosphatase APP1